MRIAAMFHQTVERLLHRRANARAFVERLQEENGRALAALTQLEAERRDYEAAHFWDVNQVARYKDDITVLRAKLASQGAVEDSATAGTGSLRLLCVGTGRDGTTSMARIVEDALDSRGLGETVAHEWGAVELNAAFCEWKESSDPRELQRICAILVECPHAAIVGNGYATVLPILAEIYGAQLRVVHLRRRDRNAFIESFAQNVSLYPVNHRYYSVAPEATGKRPAAFHFGEMSRAEWDELPLAARCAWYYDKTHALISEARSLFDHTLEVETEAIGQESTRERLAALIGTDVIPQAVHLNRHVTSEGVRPVQRRFLQRLLGKLDADRLARDELYGLRHVVDEYARFFSDVSTSTDRDDVASQRHRAAIVAEAHAILEAGIASIRGLERANRMSGQQRPAGVNPG